MDKTVSNPNYAGMAVFTPVINGELPHTLCFIHSSRLNVSNTESCLFIEWKEEVSILALSKIHLDEVRQKFGIPLRKQFQKCEFIKVCLNLFKQNQHIKICYLL